MSSKTVTSPTFRYPMSYPLNRANVKKFIAASAPDARDAVKKFIKATTHISFETFITYVNKNLREVVKLVPDGRSMFVYLEFKNRFYIYKSNYWIFIYIKQVAESKYGLEVKFVNNLNNSMLIKNDVVLLVDDCIYTGKQMGETISEMTNYEFTKFNIILFTSFMSEDGLKHILECKAKNRYLCISTFTIPKYVYYIKPLGHYMTLDEIISIMKYYQPGTIANRIQVATEYDGPRALKKYPIYFDHKLADEISSFPRIYSGIVPQNGNFPIAKRLETDVHLKDMEIYYLDQYDDNYEAEYKRLQDEYISLKKKYEAELKKLVIIPLIKNCEYDRQIVMLDSSCPPPPYKAQYDEFIAIIKNMRQEQNSVKHRTLRSSLPIVCNRRTVSISSQASKSIGSRLASRSLRSLRTLTSKSRKTRRSAPL